MTVSIIVPTRNEENSLEKLLKSLKKQTYKNYEVIVVDGGSSDGTERVAKKYGARFIREYGKYKSPANARNIGMQKAKGEIAIVLDCDYEVGGRFLEEGVKAFSKKGIAGVVCSHKLAEDTPVEKTLASKIKTRMGIVHVYPIFTRRGFIQKMGGWDASLGYGEDRDLNNSILRYNEKHEGRALRANGPAVIIHLPHTLSELSAQQRWYGRTIKHYLRKGKGAKEYLPLLKVFYILVPVAVLMALFETELWLPVALLSLPFILVSLYRTTMALVRGKIWGLCLLPIDVFMSFPFAYGLIESIFRKERGRD